MKAAAAEIFTRNSIKELEENITPVQEIFRLQGMTELLLAEQKYLPGQTTAKAVILAAARGVELGELTEKIPKAMVSIGKKKLVEHSIDTFRAIGINDVNIVRGYARENFKISGARFFDNEKFDSTGEAYSLYQAITAVQGELVLIYGDVLVKKYVLQQLLEAEGDIILAIDSDWESSRNSSRKADFVTCSDAHSRRAFNMDIDVISFLTGDRTGKIHGEWMGVAKFSAEGSRIVSDLLKRLFAESVEKDSHDIPALFEMILQSGKKIKAVYASNSSWLDIDSIDDVIFGSSFL